MTCPINGFFFTAKIMAALKFYINTCTRCRTGWFSGRGRCTTVNSLSNPTPR